MMKVSLPVAVVFACMLAGCSRDETPASSDADIHVAASETEPAEAAPPTKPRAVPAPEGQRGEDILAVAGVEFPFPHEVLYDILDTSESGTPRHRVLVEVQSGAFDSAMKRFGESLVDLGYEKVSDSDEGGRVQQVYTQADKPTYYLLMQPAGMGPKLHGPESVGSIHIMWNIPGGI